MIYFDRKTLDILIYIKLHSRKGASWDKIQHRFGEDSANSFLLQNLSKELYTVTKGQNGKWINFEKENPIICGFYSFITPKGNEFIEKRYFDFWKWIIPTLISISALIVSVLK